MALSDLISTLVYIPRVTIIFLGYKWLVHGLAGLIFCHIVSALVEITVIVSAGPNDNCDKHSLQYRRLIGAS